MSHDQRAIPASQTAQTSLAQQLFDEAFNTRRDPRSAEYKAGALYILQFKAGEIDRTPPPYKSGTVQADAWFGGTNEGHIIWRQSLAHARRVAESAL